MRTLVTWLGKFVAAAAVMAASLGGARVAMAQPGGFNTSPPVNEAELGRIVKKLGMEPQQAEAAKGVFDGYLTAFQEKADAFSAQMDKMREQMREDRDPSMFQDMMDKASAFAKVREDAEASLMTNLKSLLTSEQAAAWPGVERMRRRESINELDMGPGGSGWERVDLLKIVEDAKLPDEERDALKPILEPYELELDRALVPAIKVHEKAMSQMRELLQAFMENDTAKLQGIFDESHDVVVRMLDLNRGAAKQILAALPPEDAASLSEKIHRQAHPQVYGMKRPARDAMIAALKFDDLEPAQKSAIESLKASYEHDSAALDKDAEASIEQKASEMTLDKLMTQMKGGGMFMNDQFKDVRASRKELEGKTMDGLKGILTDAQKERLEKK